MNYIKVATDLEVGEKLISVNGAGSQSAYVFNCGERVKNIDKNEIITVDKIFSFGSILAIDGIKNKWNVGDRLEF